MAKGDWWFKFELNKWRTDSSLRRCSLEARGFWLEVLCIMTESGSYELVGSYEELGWLIGCSPEIAARCILELKQTVTADVTLGNGSVTLVSRKLKRELSDREKTRLRVQKFRSNGHVTVHKKEVISNKKEKEKNKDAHASLSLQVFEHWQCSCDKQNFSFSDSRKKIIEARLKDGFTVEQLNQAIDTAWSDPFYRGENGRNTEYMDFKTIFKNKDKVENFLFGQKNGNGHKPPMSENEIKMREALEATAKMCSPFPQQ